MRFFETDEQRRIRIRSLFQVFLEVYLGASVEIYLTLFISFTEHHTLAFLESENFEDAIRNAVCIGGDSDTIGAMTGALAEAYYGVLDELKTVALSMLSPDLRAIYDRFYEFLHK